MEGSEEKDPAAERLELLQGIAQSVGGFLQQFAPGLGVDSTASLAYKVAEEQLDVIDTQIAPSLVGDAALLYPTLVFSMYSVENPENGVEIRCAKALYPQQEIGVAVQTAMVLSLLNSPHMRAALRVRGYVYTIGQSATPTSMQKSKLVLL